VGHCQEKKTTLTCPYDIYAYRRMPSGLCNVPTIFQCCMMTMFSHFIEDIMEVFMDNFYVYGSSLDNCLVNLEEKKN